MRPLGVAWCALLLGCSTELGSPPTDVGSAAADVAVDERCPAELTWCDSTCVDLRSDPLSCGHCQSVCARGDRCVDGRCVCPEGQGRCDGFTCIPLNSNSRCGACDTRCTSPAVCRDGRCQVPCGSGAMLCRGRCVFLLDDSAHCGACGRSCASGASCIDGACVCPSGQTACGGACRDLSRDPQACGACGRACSHDEACEGGRCVPCAAGRATCGGAVCGVDLQRDPANCGACGVRCASAPDPFVESRCVVGRCVTVCQPGRGDCTGAPGCETDLAVEGAHCGACDRRCGDGQRCAEGQCVAAWPRPLRPMSGAEVSSRRPRFAWRLGAGQDGARIEICATRACAPPLRVIDVSGDRHTLEAPLVPAVYFWQLRGRRGATLDADAGVVWPVAVSAVDGPLTPEHVRADFDGDGHSDPTPMFPARPPEPVVCWPDRFYREWSAPSEISSIGDFDGDGYGDALLSQEWVVPVCGAPATASGRGYELLRGGVRGLRRTDTIGFETRFRGTDVSWIVRSVEDFDGDGRADFAINRMVGNEYSLAVILAASGLDIRLPLGWTSPGSRYRPNPIVAAGDFDDDLGAELTSFMTDDRGVDHWMVFRVADGAASELALPRCIAAGATPLRGPWYTRSMYAVQDDDRDGVIDVIADAQTDDGARVRVRWYGGRGAPRSDRCAAVP